MSEIESKCIGVGLNLTQLKEFWSLNDCPTVFNNIINTNGNVRAYNPAGFVQVVTDFDYLFSTYFTPSSSDDGKGGHRLAIPGQPGYDSFQDVLLNACTYTQYGLQGVCQQAGTRMCRLCSRSQTTDSTPILQLCGCYVTPLSPSEYPGITPGCDPLCVQERVSKNRDVATGEIESCVDNVVCVIDNVSITAAKSLVSGVTFTQVCPQCSAPGGCICVVDTTTASAANTVGINDVTFQQNCGTGSVCVVIDNTTQTSEVVECNLQTVGPTEYYFPVPGWAWFLAVFFILLGFLVLVAYVQSLTAVTKDGKVTYSSTL